MLGLTPDLLRLVAVPLLGWAAWRDVETRRVPNAVWYPMGVVGVVLLGVGLVDHFPPSTLPDSLYLFRAAVSLGFVAPLSYAFWRLGGFGGADAKALIALSLLFPTYPTYTLLGTTLPLTETTLGVFSLTVLTNTVLLALAYPAALAARNALAGDVAPVMFVGCRVPTEDLPHTHGRLFESTEGLSRGGLDLDALRMYLRWRGTTLENLRNAPAAHRDPGGIVETYDPGDGAVGRRPADRSDGPADRNGDDDVDAADPPGRRMTDGGKLTDGSPGSDATETPSGDERGERPADSRPEDPWGAGAFLDDVDGRAYGATPGSIRDGLAVVASRDEVWVSPGIPFVVPMFLGLVVALGYGDLLFGLLGLLGVV